MYEFLDVDYDSDILLDLFHKSNKNLKGIMYEVTDPIDFEFSIIKLFELFNFIKFNRKNIFLGEIVKESPPYINPGNNGQIIFPLFGELELSFYSYSGELINGRPTLPPNWKNKELVDTVLSTKTDTVVINKPIIINGLIAHSYKPLNGRSIIAALKLPLDYSWDETKIFINDRIIND